MRVLCIIAARGGSTGIPGKNIRPLLGRPLISWAVDIARRTPELNRVVVSTDSDEIAAVAQAAGAEIPFKRPGHLAQSNSGKFQVWQHALDECERHFHETYELVVDLDCTNPLLESSDISRAISQYRSGRERDTRLDAVFTVARSRKNPYFNMVEPDTHGALRMSKALPNTILSRQMAPQVFDHVAGIYVLDPAYLKRANHLLDGHTEGYVLPDEKSLDIDTEFEFQLVEYLLRRRMGGAS